MIINRLTDNGHCGHLFIAPNRSLSYRANFLLVCVVAAVCLVIGIGFSLAGAWIVLPFVLLEQILLIVVLRHLWRKLGNAQVIVLDQDSIAVIKAGVRTVVSRDRVRIVVEDSVHYTGWPRLLMIGGGRTIELGDFLNEADSRLLQKVLSHEIGLQTFKSPDCQQRNF